MNKSVNFVIKFAVLTHICCLAVAAVVVSGCDRFQTGSGSTPGNTPGVTAGDSPQGESTPVTTEIQPPKETPLYPASSHEAGAFVPDIPGKINLYVDQNSFNPTVPKNSFFGIKNKGTLDFGKIEFGETTDSVSLKIYNDKAEKLTIETLQLTDNMTIEFESSTVFPIQIEPKASVIFSLKLGATTKGKRKSDLVISSADDSRISLSLDVR